MALTRAKQKLILTGTVKDEKALEDLSLNLPLREEMLPAGWLIRAKTPWELILPAVDRILARDRQAGNYGEAICR